ncbi:iron permease FTR1 [Catenulispora acidiphila DSM 44928]|uniref:Iron permease FTR1 n=1 Tax=Catenulispora acidiphila (strain DSM 44928 / JCM 14897 / NBRC 102108 / NRRL B-24433 / ID139908) TaxID=479433 RepID=C7QEL6_CATAD|nr:iron uptake transporter permease EfeU [Catenulispora acidiphila]ACU72786.1 iron permease FTR1 [Catenulispora acidiphila DSM 44928]
MLPTFVIGLREGLEAALIVGIIAAFVSRQGRRDLLRWMAAGVATAVLLCVAVGVVLEIVSADLPQRQQEGLETVVGALAVGMVTYMVVWMKRHSRELKAQLEGLAAEAMGRGTAGRAMVVMAFLAVLREGFETVVFLLAAFHESGNTAGAAGGAVAGIVVAVALGYGIYRGGVRLNLSKFFRATGIVLVLVAAGLVATALHTAHEAGWLDGGQQATVDLTSVVRPGSVRSALLTGMLGIQSRPVLAEVVGWFAYLVPIGLYVAWPPNRKLARRTLIRTTGGAAVVGAVAAVGLVFALPARPVTNPASGSAAPKAQLVGGAGGASATAAIRVELGAPLAGQGTAATTVSAKRTGTEQHEGISTDVYTAASSGPDATRPTAVSLEQAAALNGGRLPLGVRGTGQNSAAATGTVHVSYTDSTALTFWIEPRTGRIVDLRWTDTTRATLTGTAVGDVPLDQPIATADHGLTPAAAGAAAAAARHDRSSLDDRSAVLAGAWLAGTAAVLGAVCAAVLAVTERRDRRARVAHVTAEPSATPSG